MKTKRIIGIVMTVFLAALIAGGCKEKKKAGSDTSKAVTVRMYLLGDKSKDFDLVYGEINKILKE